MKMLIACLAMGLAGCGTLQKEDFANRPVCTFAVDKCYTNSLYFGRFGIASEWSDEDTAEIKRMLSRLRQLEAERGISPAVR